MTSPLQAKESIKMSLGQYRIADSSGSYWYTPVSATYKNSSYKARLSVPYISDYQSRSGLGNATIKLSYLSQWNSLYIDFHAKQKLDTADSDLTLPVKDRAASVEISGYMFGGVGFIELGHWWRKDYHTTFQEEDPRVEGKTNQYISTTERENSFYYVLGAVYPVKKGWITGLVMDYKPTSLGNLDRAVSGLLQYKVSAKQKISATLGKGLSDSSPDWISGLNWSVKY
jgi:hypothetical protein